MKKLLHSAILAALAAFIYPPGALAANNFDRNCAVTRISFNDAFSTYWTAEGVGLVGWRLQANLNVYDQCDHGGIAGNVAVYDGSVKAKRGAVIIGLQYHRNFENGWRNDLLRLTPFATAGGWTYYSVSTDNNIGMSRQSYFSHIKMNSYLIFYAVPGAARREECQRSQNTWVCNGHLGM
jgi:hypothetical protein